MKRVISLITVLLICFTLACPAFAAEDTFVPSISDKGGPATVPVKDENGDAHVAVIMDENGEPVAYLDEGCIVITPVSEVDKATEISDEDKAILKDVYDKLTKGDMELPYGDDVDADKMVIRDLFDLSIVCDEHKDSLKDGNTLELTFDLNVGKNTVVSVMVYVGGEWKAVDVVNNGDGTVTASFTEICPVAISVPVSENADVPYTGDMLGSNVMLWALLMVVSAAAIVGLVVIRRREGK